MHENHQVKNVTINNMPVVSEDESAQTVCRITKVVKSYPCISEDLRPYCRQLHSIVPQKNGLKIFLKNYFYAPAFSREIHKTFMLEKY